MKTLVVDRTHLGRRASGIERITEELFSDETLRPLPVQGFQAAKQGRFAVAMAQMARAPLAMTAKRDTIWIFSGFPPSPLVSVFRDRAVMYVHDMFLITRRQDLNRAAKVYMSLPFRHAVERLRYFLVNSLTTGEALAPFVRKDAEIRLYRPPVRNVFGLQSAAPATAANRPLILGALGTVEPRKNFRAAAEIARALGRRLERPVELHVIGRPGWGSDYVELSSRAHVKLYGFLPEDRVRAVMQGFDALICTSHDEGLGLPLIEAQYGGLQSIAPDQPVFREVLGASGVFIEPNEPEAAAATLERAFTGQAWRAKAAAAAAANVDRWNAQALRDRETVMAFLSDRLGQPPG